ncbi:MAG: biotin synthase BioB, partial [Burkholderiales bacterium]
MTQTALDQNTRDDAPSKRSVAEVEDLFALPFNDLIYRAQQAHRQHFDANRVQLSTLLSI